MLLMQATPSRVPARVQRLLHSSRLVFRVGGQPAVLLAIGFLVVGVGSAAGQPREAIHLAEAKAQPGRPTEIWNQQLEMRVFRRERTVVAARARQQSILTFQIDEFDRASQLSTAQKKKLELAGRGDIKRLFERYESLKVKFEVLDYRYTKEVVDEINAIGSALQAGLFHERSLLHKSLPNTLTAAQFERYDSMIREDQRSRHRAAIKRLIAQLSSSSPFSDANRVGLTNVLTNEIKTPQLDGPFDSYYFGFQLSRIAEEKLKPLLDDLQWQYLTRIRREGRTYEPILRQAGYFPDDDDETEKRGDPPAPVKS